MNFDLWVDKMKKEIVEIQTLIPKEIKFKKETVKNRLIKHLKNGRNKTKHTNN